ncbi:hypothetical protein [Alloscardovia omnicolens]|uniref:hypothetical protein n=1 Tax=Alloscardovia omnicolens TaxID=419015 RepID=UPI0003B5121A|nr:hypothetical protein [Alloscardovia omnicolens]
MNSRNSKQHTLLHSDEQERVEALARPTETLKASRWQTFSNLQRAAKWHYFMQEFAWRILAVVVCVAAVAYVGVQMLTPAAQPALSVAMVNMSATDEQVEQLQSQLAKNMHMHNAQDIAIDAHYSLDTNGLAKLQTLIANKSVDLVIAPKDIFEQLAGYGYFASIPSTYADSTLSSNGFKGSDDPDYNGVGKGKSSPVGLSVQHSTLWLKIFGEKAAHNTVIGMISNSPHRSACNTFMTALDINKKD